MNELGKAMFEKYGVRAQYHPHADSHVDTEENVPLPRRHRSASS